MRADDYTIVATGMTVAERWREVGRRVEHGENFSVTVLDVFDEDPDHLIGSGDWFDVARSTLTLESHGYYSAMSMLAYFLALEAEDAATQDAEPYPQTADVVAEEEPIQVSQMERAGVGQAAFNGYLTKILDHKPERRSSWNAKLADGLRKWAHWLEERF